MSTIHLLILAVHLLATISKIMRPGGVRAVVAESVLLKYQLVISSRAPNLIRSIVSFWLLAHCSFPQAAFPSSR
jgi:hypothetical protein